ncbi:MAG: DNA topoisomerase (ATP-hydrolyzing) subunit B [Methanobacteriota archaeon]|nr:MAG: DNA topoisomerase (ATP-hydrolyzing) subunit B [Euryarchaeota archaeon]
MILGESYSAKHIKILKGLEGVRQRPAMYIGDTSKRGFHHLMWEIIDNSVDEALAGYCDKIVVELMDSSSAKITDNGRGIPVDIHPETGRSALEEVVTTLHAGGKFEKSAYKVSGGLHGVGVSVVNALSSEMVVEVRRDGKLYRQEYERGIAKTPVQVVGEAEGTGTSVFFRPDKEIFGELEWDVKLIESRVKELAYLNPGLTIILVAGNKREEYSFPDGIAAYVKHINEVKKAIHNSVIYGKEEPDGYGVEFALQYNETYYPTILSFTNTIRNEEGGTHVIGFKSALTRAVNDFIKKQKLSKDKRVGGDDVLEGITAVIHVKVPEPQFEGQTKTKLGNSEVKHIVEKVVYDILVEWFEKNLGEAKIIAKKALSAMEAREAAKKAKESVRRKTVFETSFLPGKLADCMEKDREKAELFIVEGESAGGSAKQGRDRNFQAILPLKGKIINVEKANQVKVLKNEEIKSLILAIGTNIGNDFDMSKLRYGKIIIMTDADVDGNHIRTLLLTFLFRYMKPLIESGNVYVAQPPLYKIWKGKKVEYAYSDEEKDSIVEQLGGNVNVQRYKGLGEMNPEQLWETTMNPEKRLLKKIEVEDAEMADELFSILMGEDVSKRREFIEAHAAEVSELDV